MRTGLEPESGWGVEAIDTSRLSPEQVAAEVLAWCRRVFRGEAQVMLSACSVELHGSALL